MIVQQNIPGLPTLKNSEDGSLHHTSSKAIPHQNSWTGRAHDVPETLQANDKKVKAETEPQNFDLSPAPGNYQSDLGLFLDATSTKLARLPDPSRGEWAVIIARRQGSLEVWALSPEGSVALLGGISRRRSFDFVLGAICGLLLYFAWLVYL
jgi:hypothetical protein